MATKGILTAGKLKQFLNGFEDDTRVVMGCQGSDFVLIECHANTYYPPGKEDEWPWVIIDEGDGL